MALIIAALSWLASLGILFLHDKVLTWQLLVSLALVDLLFIQAFRVSKIDHVKKRWICCLLYWAIVISVLIAPLSYTYQFTNIPAVDLAFDKAQTIFEDAGFIISVLILVIAAIPNGLMRCLYEFDRIAWPIFSLSFVFSHIDSGDSNSKESL